VVLCGVCLCGWGGGGGVKVGPDGYLYVADTFGDGSSCVLMYVCVCVFVCALVCETW
jgi:hypothetical protein